jgi:predicted TPR repeat methyltransferase
MKRKPPGVQRFDDRLSKVYSATENKEQQYDEWAATYESDLVNDLDYVAHKEAGNKFSVVVPDKSAKILDVACGTGLVGEYLRSLGYSNIHGVDFSMNMIAISRDRDIYQSIWQHDFTRPVIQEGQYDALICVGLFAYTIPGISDMHNVVNCVKPGGICVITVNGSAWVDLGLESQLMAEATHHNFVIEQITQTQYIKKEGIDARVLVIKSC